MGIRAAPLVALLDLLRVVPDRRRFRSFRQPRHATRLHRDRGVLVLHAPAQTVGRILILARRVLRRVVAR